MGGAGTVASVGRELRNEVEVEVEVEVGVGVGAEVEAGVEVEFGRPPYAPSSGTCRARIACSGARSGRRAKASRT